MYVANRRRVVKAHPLSAAPLPTTNPKAWEMDIEAAAAADAAAATNAALILKCTAYSGKKIIFPFFCSLRCVCLSGDHEKRGFVCRHAICFAVCMHMQRGTTGEGCRYSSVREGCAWFLRKTKALLHSQFGCRGKTTDSLWSVEQNLGSLNRKKAGPRDTVN